MHDDQRAEMGRDRQVEQLRSVSSPLSYKAWGWEGMAWIGMGPRLTTCGIQLMTAAGTAGIAVA